MGPSAWPDQCLTHMHPRSWPDQKCLTHRAQGHDKTKSVWLTWAQGRDQTCPTHMGPQLWPDQKCLTHMGPRSWSDQKCLTHLTVLRNTHGRFRPHQAKVNGPILQGDGGQVSVVVRLEQEPAGTKPYMYITTLAFNTSQFVMLSITNINSLSLSLSVCLSVCQSLAVSNTLPHVTYETSIMTEMALHSCIACGHHWTCNRSGLPTTDITLHGFIPCSLHWICLPGLLAIDGMLQTQNEG